MSRSHRPIEKVIASFFTERNLGGGWKLTSVTREADRVQIHIENERTGGTVIVELQNRDDSRGCHTRSRSFNIALAGSKEKKYTFEEMRLVDFIAKAITIADKGALKIEPTEVPPVEEEKFKLPGFED
ncbi:MAG: hypothetical protein AB1546_13065 [bacterium]